MVVRIEEAIKSATGPNARLILSRGPAAPGAPNCIRKTARAETVSLLADSVRHRIVVGTWEL